MNNATRLGDLTVGQMEHFLLSYLFVCVVGISLFVAAVFFVSAIAQWRTNRKRSKEVVDYAGVHRAANEAFSRQTEKIIARQRAEHPELYRGGDAA